MLDQISHLKKDLELSCTERKQDEGSHSSLLQDNSRMHRSLSELRTAQVGSNFVLVINSISID